MNQAQLLILNQLKDRTYRLYEGLKDLEDDVLKDTKTLLEQLQHAFANENFVVLDTETTGLYDGEIIEIAILDHNGMTLMDQRIKPHGDIPIKSTNVHGITIDMLEDCPHFEDVVVTIKGHLAGKDVIVYNATYDRKMLHKSAEYAGIDKVNWKSFSNWICAMEAFSPIYGEWNGRYGNFRWQKLITAASYYGISLAHAHSALGDCLMTLEVVRNMIKGDTE